MQINIILAIILWHFFADFIMQDAEWAENKSKSLKALLKHTALYSVIWFIPLILIFGFWTSLLFVATTFVFHTVTDYFTSKHTSKQYQKGNFGGPIPRGMDFFVTIGLDQVLHYFQLILTYLWCQNIH